MLHVAGDRVRLLLRQAEHVGEQALGEAVPADHPLGLRLALRREQDPLALPDHQAVALELLEIPV
jgi:hypothetical protein